ncbi:MAG: hypothetical protein PVJ49_03255 [Acidobacteriota bacterium]|jgi:hypothetical protein
MSPLAASDNGDNGGRCPECDEHADWQVSRRHRFSPFGAVLLTVLAFWTAVICWLLGLGYTIPLILLAAAVIIGVATRKAEICSNCGFVRPQ